MKGMSDVIFLFLLIPDSHFRSTWRRFGRIEMHGCFSDRQHEQIRLFLFNFTLTKVTLFKLLLTLENISQQRGHPHHQLVECLLVTMTNCHTRVHSWPSLLFNTRTESSLNLRQRTQQSGKIQSNSEIVKSYKALHTLFTLNEQMFTSCRNL